MTQAQKITAPDAPMPAPVHVTAGAGARALVVCEHASNYMPAAYNDLGLAGAARASHVAWDPGALPVARGIAAALGAPLVAGGYSRLIYDCNRPPEARDAIPARSEVFDIPGNAALDDTARAARVADCYAPFQRALSAEVARIGAPALITVHSFTPVYAGKPRAVDIGILHDTDTRLADMMLAHAAQHTALRVARNAPYGPQDGVTHTLRLHALPHGALNVMLEVRNDLIADEAAQAEMAQMLARWLRASLAACGTVLDAAP